MSKEQLLSTALQISNLHEALNIFEEMFVGDESSIQYRINAPFPEIGNLLSASVIHFILSGLAAVFSDPARSCGNENMSLRNLQERYKDCESHEAKKIFDQIESKVNNSNIKMYRNKYLSHIGLDEALGKAYVNRFISVNLLREIFELGNEYLLQLQRDANILSSCEYWSYSTKLPEYKSVAKYLSRFNLDA